MSRARSAARPREPGTSSRGGVLAETQRRLVDYYGLSWIPPVVGFVRPAALGGRERLWIRESGQQLELALELPRQLLALPAVALEVPRGRELDALCQLIEGVSHFVLLADRALRGRSTTELELELQAELDKYVVLVIAPPHALSRSERLALRARLFLPARFIHPAGTVVGDRYRLAHRLAWRLTCRFEERYLGEARGGELRAELRWLYRASQEEKLALAA